jgi:hypothetical protein
VGKSHLNITKPYRRKNITSPKKTPHKQAIVSSNIGMFPEKAVKPKHNGFASRAKT